MRFDSLGNIRALAPLALALALVFVLACGGGDETAEDMPEATAAPAPTEAQEARTHHGGSRANGGPN